MIRQHPNAELFDLIERVGTFVLANLFWVIFSIPLVTMPIATAGLFATLTPWARGKPSEVFQDFFGGVRRYWLKALLAGAVDAVLAVLVIADFSIFRLMNMAQPLALLSQSVTLFVAFIAIMVNLYFWPLMVTCELPFRELLDASLKFVFMHPVWSVMMLVMELAIVAGSLLFLPGAALVLVTGSTLALTSSWAAWRIIRRYVVEEDHVEIAS
jgi:uncharacterized membrane protein YesL